MSTSIKFTLQKKDLEKGFYNFKVYSYGYSCGESIVFLYEGYVYLYNDECDRYKYNKPYTECSEEELEDFVNSTIDNSGDSGFAWDEYTTFEEFNHNAKEYGETADEYLKDLADNEYEIVEPFEQEPKWESLIARAEEEEIGNVLFEVQYDANKTTRKQALADMEMAGKYASLAVWEGDLDVEDFVKEGLEEYDKDFVEMARFRCSNNGLDTFQEYLEKKGYVVTELRDPEPDFTFEW